MAGANAGLLTNEVKRLREQVRLLSRTKNILIGTLLSDCVELRGPLPVLLEHDGHQYVASSADLEVYGFGATELEALADFRRAVADFYLNLRHDKLGTELRRRFEYLKSVIREK